MHRFAPLPQRKLPSSLTLQLEDPLPYALITPPPTSVPAHLMPVQPSPPLTESATPLASPAATSLQDFVSLMNNTNYLQQVIANRIQMAQLEGMPSDEEGPFYDPLLGDQHNSGSNLYLSPFAYDQVSMPPAMLKHRRADSQASLKSLESSGDESLRLKRKRDHDEFSELDGAEVKRQTHIQSEQKRRAQIKDGFEELRQHLPLSNLSSKKMSKATILINTVIYLQQLKASHQALTQELDNVQKENEQLRALHGNVFGV